jgi:hypothetical protein
MVHVFAGGTATSLIRSVTDDTAEPLGNLVAETGFAATAGSVMPGTQLYLLGNQFQGSNQGIGRLTIPVDPMLGVTGMPAPEFTEYPTPVDWFAPNYGTPIFAQNGQVVHYVVACELSQPTNGASLWVGSSDGPPAEVATGQRTDLLMNPLLYAYVNNASFVVFLGKGGKGPGVSAYAYGSAADLSKTTPFALQANDVSVPFALVPSLANDGFALFLASVDSTTSVSIWGGTVHPAGFSSLGQTPPPALAQLASQFTASTFAALNGPTVDADTIYMAGPTFTSDGVNFSWTLRDGTPLLLEWPAYTTTSTTVIAAGAAPLGLFTLVVWMEYQGTTFMVNAQKLFCTETGG